MENHGALLVTESHEILALVHSVRTRLLPVLDGTRPAPEDLARFFWQATHGSVAGIRQHGRPSAAEFLTDADAFIQALEVAPPDWSSKSMQVAIRSSIVWGSAAHS